MTQPASKDAFAEIGRLATATVEAYAEAGRQFLKAVGALKDLTQDDFVLVPDPIEEQVKPAVKEPKEFGSIVRAGYDAHTDRVLWVRTPGGWYAEESAGFHAYFPGLYDPEVLRIGIGGPKDAAPEDRHVEVIASAYKQGVQDTIDRGVNALNGFHHVALTAERKDAYQNAINVLRELS